MIWLVSSLTIEPTPHGSRVIATWEKHPLTKGSVVWMAVLSTIAVASLLAVSVEQSAYRRDR